MTEAALAIQAGIRSEELVADYGEKTIEAAYKARRDVSLSEVFVQAARANGYTGSGNIRSSLPLTWRWPIISRSRAMPSVPPELTVKVPLPADRKSVV